MDDVMVNLDAVPVALVMGLAPADALRAFVAFELSVAMRRARGVSALRRWAAGAGGAR
jgi:hypothetical protein